MDDPPGPARPPETPAHWSDALRLTAGEVVRRRLLAVMLLRIGGLLAAVAALAPIASWFSEGLRDSDLLNFEYYLPRILMAVALLVVGVVALLLAPRLARMLIPVHTRPLCPACGFDVQGLAEPRCPECGLAFVTDPARSRPPLQYQVWITGAVVGVRLLAIGYLVLQAVRVLSFLYWYDFEDVLYRLFYPIMGGTEFVQSAGWAAVSLGPAVALWVGAPWIARRALRFRRRLRPRP